MTTPRWMIDDFLQNVHLQQGVGMSRARKPQLYTHFQQGSRGETQVPFCCTCNQRPKPYESQMASPKVRCRCKDMQWRDFELIQYEDISLSQFQSNNHGLTTTANQLNNICNISLKSAGHFQQYRVKQVNSDISILSRIQFNTIHICLSYQNMHHFQAFVIV